jgi:multiple sugar transport system ATP-binding protein
MNHGVIEQLAPPQEIYDRPATMFVADFIGAPSMNLLEVAASVAPGDTTLRLGAAAIAMPRLHQAASGQALALGVRPEHVQLADDSPLRGEVFGTEYLGTTQIVTLTTAHGVLRARTRAEVTLSIGEQVGIKFRPEKLSLFDRATGRALASALHQGPA